MPEPANAPLPPQQEVSPEGAEAHIDLTELAAELGEVALASEFIPASRQDAIDSALANAVDAAPESGELQQQQIAVDAARNALAQIYGQPQLQN